MIEVTGDLWVYPGDVRVITTNGTIKKDGSCVMGRGCALEAAKKWPTLPRVLGERIQRYGNQVHYLLDYNLFTFPVKHNWYEKADLGLIKQSAEQLQELLLSSYRCVMPRPGCGNGKLSWELVKPVLASILDDRFYIITQG